MSLLRGGAQTETMQFRAKSGESGVFVDRRGRFCLHRAVKFPAALALPLLLVGCDTLENRRDLYSPEVELYRPRTTATTTVVRQQRTTTTQPEPTRRTEVKRAGKAKQPPEPLEESPSLPPP